MAKRSTLTDLAYVRDKLADHDRERARTVSRRDELILRALDEGFSEREVGRSAGISNVAVHKKRG